MSDAKFPSLVNPHALEAMVEAGARRTMVAAVDIYDDKGTKLWARDRPISAEMRERLQARRLRQPLETSIRFAAGLSASALTDSLRELLDSDHVVGRMVEPWARTLLETAPALLLRPVAELLLTTMIEARPAMFAHAARGMALAGAMALRANQSSDGVQLAMLGGLLHDVGELYLERSYLDLSGSLDLAGYRRVAAHPRVSQLLLSELGRYPKALVVAVGEHHERLDGSGYPTQRRDMSSLGRMLAVMEATLGVLSSAGVPCERAGFALRVMPGEHDPLWTGFVTTAARRLRDGASQRPGMPGDGLDGESDPMVLHARLRNMNAVVVDATSIAAGLAAAQLEAVLHQVAGRALARLERIRASWNELGLWSGAGEVSAAIDAFEADMALQEIGFRLSTLRRDCLWPEAVTSSDFDVPPFDSLWECVQGLDPPQRH